MLFVCLFVVCFSNSVDQLQVYKAMGKSLNNPSSKTSFSSMNVSWFVWITLEIVTFSPSTHTHTHTHKDSISLSLS